MAKQTLNITAADPVAFVKRLLEAGKNGAVLKDRTFPRIKGVPFVAELEIDTDIGVESKPGVNAIPVPLGERVYTKEELDTMEWETFKQVVASRNVGGRKRDLMTNKYLKIIAGQDTGSVEDSEED